MWWKSRWGREASTLTAQNARRAIATSWTSRHPLLYQSRARTSSTCWGMLWGIGMERAASAARSRSRQSWQSGARTVVLSTCLGSSICIASMTLLRHTAQCLGPHPAGLEECPRSRRRGCSARDWGQRRWAHTNLGISATATSIFSGRRYMIWAISNMFKNPCLATSALASASPARTHALILSATAGSAFVNSLTWSIVALYTLLSAIPLPACALVIRRRGHVLPAP